jgi:methionyl-tRNA formyltransferase
MHTPYKVIFCGTPDFAVPSLQAFIHDEQFEVVAVITQPDRPVGRKMIITPPPVKQVALKNNIPVFQPDKLKHAAIESIACDYIVVVAYGQIISQAVLNHPSIAPINVHGSLLPRWRGASPIQASIAAGDTMTGISIQKMVKELDAGDILSTVQVPITNTTTSVELFNKLASLGAHLLLETLKNPLTPIPQDESFMTHCGKLTRADGLVDPATDTAELIERKWRAYHPWPGIQIEQAGEVVKLIEVSLTETNTSVPLQCAESTILHVVKVQVPGKNVVHGKEWK